MAINVKKDNQSGLNAIVVGGLEKDAKSEEIATGIVLGMIRNEIIAPYTLNNWKNVYLVIRYVTNTAELGMLFDAIKSDISLPANRAERSLLYKN